MDLKIFVIFLLINSVRAYNKEGEFKDSNEILKEQTKRRHIVDSYGSLNVVIDFEILHESTESDYDPLKLINQLRILNVFTETLIFIELYGDKFYFEVQGQTLSLIVKYSAFDIEMDLSFLGNDMCIKNLKTTVWKIKSQDSFCIMMFMCNANGTEESGKYIFTERLIFIVDDNHNLSTINDYINRGGHTIMPNQQQGFCMCSFLKTYLTDVKIDHEISRYFIILIFLILVLSFYVSIEIYLIIIKIKVEEKLFKKTIRIRD